MDLPVWVVVAATAVAAVALYYGLKRRRPKVDYGTVNYLIPGKDDEPLKPREVFVAGINRVGLCGQHRQAIIAKLRKGEPIFLVRQPDNPHDSNAVILYRADGTDIGYLPRATAEEIAPRLDKGSPVTATVAYTEEFEVSDEDDDDDDYEADRPKLLGARLWLVAHKLKASRR